jgi:hypothetical protein
VKGCSAEINWALTWLREFALAYAREVFLGALPQNALLARVQLVF